MDGPRAHFLLAGGEVRLQAEQVVAGADQPVEARRLESERLEKRLAVFVGQLRELGFDLGGEGNDLGVLAARRRPPRATARDASPRRPASSASVTFAA